MHEKTVKQKILSLILAAVMIAGVFSVLVVPSSAAPALPAANTETRHAKVCTSLSADAVAYYTGSYTYASLSALSGAKNTTTSANAAQNNPLYTALQTLMTSTHTFQTSYSGTGAGSLAYYWQRTDAQNGNAGSFVLVYSDQVVSIGSTSSFNREHVWPKSNASFNQSNGGSDLHHLRPANPTVNSTRGNLPFGNVQGIYSNATHGSCYWKTSSLFEPEDNVKGDVARILLYVYVRWGENNIYSDTSNGGKIIESLDTLLEWIELDPVDTWEMKRNDLIEDVQGNRNVFIDYPELAFKLFGKSVPSSLVTPSGGAVVCTHVWSLTSSTPPTCTEDGVRVYTCTKCGDSKTEYDRPNGHTNKLLLHTEPTCTETGVTIYRCTVCGEETTQTAAALGHSFGAGSFTVEPSCTEAGVISYPCERCDYVKTETYAAYGHSYGVGTVTLEPTCTETGVKSFTCSRCGDVRTEPVGALGHVDDNRDGSCDRCGEAVEIPSDFVTTTTVSDGMHLYIYHPAQGKVLTTEASGAKLLGTSAVPSNGALEAVDGGAVFVVSMSGDGFYLIHDGQYLSTISAGNDLHLSESPDDYSLWKLVEVGSDDLVYIYSVNAAYNGNHNQALEYYGGGYTVYGQKTTNAYQYQLYALPGHCWDDGTVTQPAENGNNGTVLYTCVYCGETKEESMNIADVNEDGVVNVSDVSALLDFLSSPVAALIAKHDLDGSGAASIRDVAFLLDILSTLH